MSKILANAAIAISLMLTASVSTPAWAGKSHDANCPMAKHKLAKRSPVAAKAKPARGMMIIDQRKNVQILSFGP